MNPYGGGNQGWGGGGYPPGQYPPGQYPPGQQPQGQQGQQAGQQGQRGQQGQQGQQGQRGQGGERGEAQGGGGRANTDDARTGGDGALRGDDSGGFEPRRFLPTGKLVVLALVTSKRGELASKDALTRRLEEARRDADLD